MKSLVPNRTFMLCQEQGWNILRGFSMESWLDSLVKDERNQCLFQWEKRIRSWGAIQQAKKD